MSKRYWKGSDLKIAVELTDKKGNPIPFANVDELVIYLKTTGEEYVKVSKGSGIEADADGNIYVRLNEHSLDNLPDGLLRYDARWKMSVEGWDNGYDTVQSCETDIFVKTPDNYVPKANVQEKAVTYTANGDYVLTPDGSYEGMSRADIKVELPLESKAVTYTANGDYSVVPSEGYEGLQDVAIHIEIDTSEAENDGMMKFLRKQMTGKVELPIEAMDTPYCLYKQTGLTEVVVPEGAASIPNGFFQYCTSLAKITYPDSIAEFGNGIYDGIDIEKIKSFPLPPYLKYMRTPIFYMDGEVFNVPKYINEIQYIYSYNGSIAKRLNFKGNLCRFYFQSFRAEEMDFRYNVQVPRFNYTSIYTGMTKVIVPESLYDTWITTSPWSDYAAITESIPDTDYFIPYQTKSGNDIALTTGVKEDRYAVISYSDKKIHLRGTPWQLADIVKSSDITFVDFAASNLEVPAFSGLFRGCSSLTGLTLPKNKPLSCREMFNGCTSLTTIPEMDTSYTTDMYSMFYGCSSLTTIPEIATSNVNTMERMFEGCSSLTSIPEMNTSRVTNMTDMFYGCSSLTTIPLLDTSRVTDMLNMLSYCSSLTDLGGFTGLKVNLDLSYSSKLTHDSLMNVINKAADVTASPKTLTLGATNLAKLTDAEKGIATSKGWTLA